MTVLMTVSVLLLACTKDDPGDSGVELAGPVLSHEVPTATFAIGEDIPLSIAAEDADGVGGIDVVYRDQGGAFWNTVEASTEDGVAWTATIPGADVEDPGVEYYLRATDLHPDQASTSYLPADIDEPFGVTIALIGEALPFEADFELEPGDTLYTLGFASASLGFAGYQWDESEAQANSGITSLAHGRGVEGVPALDDWLISPPLDLSSTDAIQLTWWEYGQGVEAASHSIAVSTGSRDPESGEFVELVVLDAPTEDGWSRAAVVDLSEYAGESAVYIAWRYQGEYADDWYIDDVLVRSSAIDLEPTLTWSPDPVHPDETATLTLELENLVEIEGGELTVTASLPEGGGAFASDTDTIGSVPSLGVVGAQFELTVDAAWPDNAYLPVDFAVDDGETSWLFEEVMVVGEPSAMRLELTLTDEALLQVDLGVGDPDDPTWEEQLYADVPAAGVLELSHDLTDMYEMLPPAPGDERWYARITSEAQGRVDAFEIDHGDTTYEASVTPTWVAGDELVVYLPEPPEPTISSTSVSPTKVAPGDSISVSSVLMNSGDDTADQVFVELVSSDPDVTISSGGPVELTDDVWEGGDWWTTDTMSFQVSDEHLDSTPVELAWSLDDGVESWMLPFDVEVPWPVMKVTSVVIDDGDGGDDDGLLEPGETAELEVEITNVGDLAASGIVYSTLTSGAASTASVTIDEGTDTLGSLSVDASREADFTVTVDAGAALGDTFVLEVVLTDNDTSYLATAEIVLGELPWLSVSATDDAIGDAYDYTFDIVNAKYRSDGVTFELILESADEFDATTFVEMWAVASSADYTYYRLVLQSGTAKLQGYDGGFLKISEPTVEYPTAKQVKLTWDIEPMGMNNTTLSVGFGSGWCGSETDSFCDHFPDGWGYYYHDHYDTSRFFTMRW
ncbi:MAG: hypothetical protein GY884_15030 [Proteobacteria bacterium]|nr:hypothetical protein [Pseudomonadota bacterium]